MLAIGIETGRNDGARLGEIDEVVAGDVRPLRKPIGIGMVANLSKDTAMASVLSAESQTNSLFTAIIAPLIGALADWLSPGTGIAIATGVLILLSPLYWLNKKLI